LVSTNTFVSVFCCTLTGPHRYKGMANTIVLLRSGLRSD
jgi:hypothetical protein